MPTAISSTPNPTPRTGIWFSSRCTYAQFIVLPVLFSPGLILSYHIPEGSAASIQMRQYAWHTDCLQTESMSHGNYYRPKGVLLMPVEQLATATAKLTYRTFSHRTEIERLQERSSHVSGTFRARCPCSGRPESGPGRSKAEPWDQQSLQDLPSPSAGTGDRADAHGKLRCCLCRVVQFLSPARKSGGLRI